MRSSQPPRTVSSYPSITMDELLSGTDDKMQENLAKSLNRISLQPERLIFRRGDTVDDLFILRDGCMSNPDASVDRTTTISVPNMPGQVFGLIEMLSGSGYEMSLRTITPADVDVIGSKRFVGLMTEDPRLCLNVATLIARLYHDAVSSIRDQ